MGVDEVDFVDEVAELVWALRDDDSGPFPFRMVHVHGCGRTAAWMTENPTPGADRSSRVFRKLDGSRFSLGSEPICGNCGLRFSLIRSGIEAVSIEEWVKAWTS